MIEIYKKLLEAIERILGIYRNMSLSELARQDLGKDFTDDAICPDDVSCAFAVTTVLQNYMRLRGKDFPIILGTDLLDRELASNPNFKRIVSLPEGLPLPANTIIVSPRTASVNGHTGIVDVDGIVMNNNSNTGLWVKSYDRMGWRKLFVEERGLVTRLYEVLI